MGNHIYLKEKQVFLKMGKNILQLITNYVTIAGMFVAEKTV